MEGQAIFKSLQILDSILKIMHTNANTLSNLQQYFELNDWCSNALEL